MARIALARKGKVIIQVANQYVLQRLEGIRKILVAVHETSRAGSSATKGNEREQFLSLFLSQVMPPPFRFGTGDVTDETGTRTGQLDIVLEYPFLPSIPMPGTSSRLYFAESIAAVIEVKSDLSGQWNQVLRTAQNVASLKPNLENRLASGTGATPNPRKIPFFAVGYRGWCRPETLAGKVSKEIDGILVIDPGIFLASDVFDRKRADGARAFWWFIYCLQRSTRVLNSPWDVPLPEGYVSGEAAV